jgi:hypothetical protein
MCGCMQHTMTGGQLLHALWSRKSVAGVACVVHPNLGDLLPHIVRWAPTNSHAVLCCDVTRCALRCCSVRSCAAVVAPSMAKQESGASQ